ncbi:MAG TPA: hypothetical protein VGP62_08165 [Bryobacteraceae bacterium]|jgi:hypothetical protein|nr:hypothetical protein [Bryobacteraceae bacterium]
MGARILCLLFLSLGRLSCQEKYDGPVPPKPDLPYLLQAKKLTEVETGQAREEKRKDGPVHVVAGPSSSARTPLPEPIFILDARQLAPEKIELFLLEVKDGNREVAAQPLHLRVTPLRDNLFKIEPSEMLDAGEYALAVNGQNRIFCFEVY